jgi:hypothetical protein
VTHMDEIEAAIGENDTFPLLFFSVCDLFEMCEGVSFFQCSDSIACLSSCGVRVDVPFFMTTRPPA